LGKKAKKFAARSIKIPVPVKTGKNHQRGARRREGNPQFLPSRHPAKRNSPKVIVGLFLLHATVTPRH
jgi:hypothetical protein